MIHQSGTTLSETEKKSVSKTERTETALIRKFFNSNSGKFTAEEVTRLVFPSYTEANFIKKRNNVRRALTDLMNDGFLSKSCDDKDKKEGFEGIRLCVYYKYQNKLAQGLLFCVEEICKDYKKNS